MTPRVTEEDVRPYVRVSLSFPYADASLFREISAAVRETNAAALGIDRGTLSVGAVADACLVDPEARWVLDDASMLSRGHNTPFRGHSLQGRVRCTLLAGQPVFEATEA